MPDEAARSEPTLAERARTLMSFGGTSSLSTMSVKHPGYPYGSAMPYAVDEDGNPIIFVSQMATHTRNLRADPRATLLVVAQAESPLAAARISVMGEFVPVLDSKKKDAAAVYLSAHPESNQWLSFGDFCFYRMTIKDVYIVGGFGVMGWVTAEDYSSAEPTPLEG